MVRSRGFTLIELMLSLSIAAVVLSVAVPSFSDFVASHRHAAEVNRFLRSIHLARSEAIKANHRVVLCKSSDAAECATSGGWEQGWIIFADLNNDAQRQVSEPLLRVEERLAGDGTLRGNFWVESYLSYQGTGITALTSGAMQMGTFVLCDGRGYEQARALVITRTGRPHVKLASESSVEDCLT